MWSRCLIDHAGKLSEGLLIKCARYAVMHLGLHELILSVFSFTIVMLLLHVEQGLDS